MHFIDRFASFIVGWFPLGWQPDPTNVALVLWLLLWAVSIIVFGCIVGYFLFFKWRDKEVNYRSTLR